MGKYTKDELWALADEFANHINDATATFYEMKGAEILPCGPIVAGYAMVSAKTLKYLNEASGQDHTLPFVRAVLLGTVGADDEKEVGA